MLSQTPEKKAKDDESEMSPPKHLVRRSAGAPRCAPAPSLRPNLDDLLKDSQVDGDSSPKPDLSKLPAPDLADRRSGFHVDVYNVGHHSRWGHANRRHYSGGAQGGMSGL